VDLRDSAAASNIFLALGFFLLSSRVHARLQTTNANRWAVKARARLIKNYRNGRMRIDLCSIEPSIKSLAYLNGRLKRCVDVFGALVGIFFCMPTFIVAALFVKFIDKVPVFFSQDRIGLHGQSFVIVKLRTLIIDEKRVTNPETIYKKQDYLTIRTGKFWRTTSIDEIVQFFLVLRGQMSLIGHRPIPLNYLPHLAQMDNMNPMQIKHYLSVVYQYKPGMSSLSSVNGRGDLTLQQKFMYDLVYAQEANLIFDIKLLLQTIYVVVSRKGAK
jgi:lipopolysaccharide/colanic/teichoic acid biosynthesis glycosyltransferase